MSNECCSKGPRIPTLCKDKASPEQMDILNQTQKAMGAVPNLVATMAHSPAVAQAYLAFNGALSKGRLPLKLRESLSLAIGETNGCQYCVSAHQFLGSRAGLTPEDIEKARRARAVDRKIEAALVFARKVVTERGKVMLEDLETLRSQGYDNGEIVEIVGHIALNLFTNYFNHIAGTEVDFPVAAPLAA